MKVYASAIGQYDNVGDTVLRRAFLDAVRGAGHLHVYVGGQTEDQLSALGVGSEDVLFRTSAAWRTELGRTLGRKPVLYAFDSGETELRKAFAMRYLRLAPLLAANRIRGGRAVHVGMGVRAASRWSLPISAVLRLVDVVTWRDHASRRAVGVGGVTPDWAFALGSPEAVLRDSDRPLLAFAVRASLPHAPRVEPGDAWADEARRVADELGLEPVFVAQIGRDGGLADRLAARAGAESVTWATGDHADFEARLRETYRRSAAVVSDRLHGLVIGASEGALPVPIGDDPTSKSTRTLAAVDITGTAVETDLLGAAERIRTVLARRDELADHVLGARAALRILAARISRMANR